MLRATDKITKKIHFLTVGSILVILLFGCSSSPEKERVEKKVKQIQELIPKWVEAGGNPAEVDSLYKQLQENMKKGDMNAAEKAADDILDIVNEPQIKKVPKTNETGSGQPSVNAGDYITAPKSVKLGKIPDNAEIVFWSTREVSGANQMEPSNLFVMNRVGGGVTQITFVPHSYGHAAVSLERNMIVALRTDGKRDALWVLNINTGTEQELVPNFQGAGSGGVDWSPDGFIYFAGLQKGASRSDIFKIKPDGTGLKQLTFVNQAEAGYESDVSVSEDGALVTYLRVVKCEENGKSAPKPRVWVANSDGSNQRMIDNGGPECGTDAGGPIGDADPEISSDNKFVVFSRTNTQYNNFKDSINTAHDLWIAPLDRATPANALQKKVQYP